MRILKGLFFGTVKLIVKMVFYTTATLLVVNFIFKKLENEGVLEKASINVDIK